QPVHDAAQVVRLVVGGDDDEHPPDPRIPFRHVSPSLRRRQRSTAATPRAARATSTAAYSGAAPSLDASVRPPPVRSARTLSAGTRSTAALTARAIRRSGTYSANGTGWRLT